MSAAIGLLGGSFDPIHAGHLQLARDALARLPLAELRFIPAGKPWQKGALTPAEHRCAMLQLALADEPRFTVDELEIRRDGPTYTIDTLRELRARLGESVPLVVVMGGDQLRNFDTWRDWARIPRLAHLAVARRNDRPLELNPALAAFVDAHRAAPAALAAQPAGAIVELPMTPVDASATEIRALLAAASPAPAESARLRALLPAGVLDYIRAHSLYR